ncbi:MAG TPA: DUF2141 domain-containing protein [Bacteroidota bacterium]|nr:DUF2141 domain-containing protein [Bacteroidota bacterium]
MKILCLVIGYFLYIAAAFAGDSSTVEISVTGFRSHIGICRCLIFHHENGFPESVQDADTALAQPVAGDTVRFSIRLRYGTYAVSVLHDENANGKMDKTWYGKPVEGIGTSNNPVIKLSSPSYSAASVVIDKIHSLLNIKLQYL